MKTNTRFILPFLFLLSYPSNGFSYDFNAHIRKQQEAKQAKRWSLSEWLAQKSKIGLMDTWLGYNLPSPYEFYLGVDTSSVNRELTPAAGGATTAETFKNYRASLGAFVTAVGLYGEHETSDEEMEQWKALFMLRLLGSSDQSTNLTLHYGLMGQDYNNDSTQFQVGGGRMNLYIIKAFALTGQYDHIFKAESEQGVQQEGFRYEAGAFIEYGALRLYGSWYKETMDLTTGAVETQRVRNGILYGFRFYF